MKLYINGEERKCNTGSIVKTHSFPGDSMFLGKDWSNRRFKGSLEEFMLFSGALADTTIKGLPHYENWPVYQGVPDHRSEVTIEREGQGHIEVQVNFNPGYSYNDIITEDNRVISFPEASELAPPQDTVYFDFVADAGWHVDDVVVDGQSQGPQSDINYRVKNDNSGSVGVIFKQ